jgi:hypothetical protein
MSQALLSRPQSVKRAPTEPLIALCDRIVQLWNDDDLTSREIAQELQRILSALDGVSIPSGLRDQVLKMRNEIVTWDREDDTLQAIVDQAVDLIDAAYKPPAKVKQADRDPSIVVEISNGQITITKGGHICGKRIGTASYRGKFDCCSDAKLPAYPLCRLREAPTAYMQHYVQGGRYLLKA